MRKWLREKALADFPDAVVAWSESRGMFRIAYKGLVPVGKMHPAFQTLGILCAQTETSTIVMISFLALATGLTPREERELGGPPTGNRGRTGPGARRAPSVIRAHGKVTEERYGTPVVAPSTPFDGAFRLDSMEPRRGAAGVVDYELPSGADGAHGKSSSELLRGPSGRGR